VNRVLGEVIVGISDDCSVEKIKREHAASSPVWMSKWEAGHAEYSFVACAMSRKDADDFASNFAHGSGMTALKVYVVG
jgi:hypothetical protein